MKQNFFKTVSFGILLLSILCTSCNRPHKIFTVVPYNASIVGTFNPGKLIKKSKANEINYIKRAIGENEFSQALFDNPETSGINLNAYSGFFVFGTENKYLGVIMPVRKLKDFESFLDSLGQEYNAEFPREKTEEYTYSKKGNNVLAWNKTVLIHLTRLKGPDNAVEDALPGLFNLEAENCVLSDKDFKRFLSKQKDLNIWLSSNQFEALTGQAMGMLNMFGTLNNNYAHISLDFQDGGILLSSNLLLNPDFKKNLDRYNVIDLNAEKNILKMLPAENLILAGNFRLNPAKMLEILSSLNSGDQHFLEEFELKTGKTPAELLNSLQGSVAFSVNGIKQTNNENNPEFSKIPLVVAALQINDEMVFSELVNFIKLQTPVIEKDNYYVIIENDLPLFLGQKNKVIVFSNEEKYLTEILSEGELKNNILSLDISKNLIDNPICFYLNLDKESYSQEMNDYLRDEMDKGLSMGLDGLGTSLKCLTLTGNIEKTEVRIDFKDKSVNSLHAILRSMEF